MTHPKNIGLALILLLLGGAIASEVGPPTAIAQQRQSISRDLLTDVTTGEGCFPINATRTMVLYVTWDPSVTAGVVELEESDVQAYTGARANLHTFSFATDDVQDSHHFTGAYGTVCARVSTTIVGGNITAHLRGQ